MCWRAWGIYELFLFRSVFPGFSLKPPRVSHTQSKGHAHSVYDSVGPANIQTLMPPAGGGTGNCRAPRSPPGSHCQPDPSCWEHHTGGGRGTSSLPGPSLPHPQRALQVGPRGSQRGRACPLRSSLKGASAGSPLGAPPSGNRARPADAAQ